MQKKYVIATSAALVILIAGALTYKVYAEKNDGIAAVVNNEKITVEEVKNAYDQNPQLKAQVPFEEFYNHAIDVMVNSKLALQAATAAHVQESEEYKKQLEELKDEVARQVYLEQQVNTKVTPEEIQKVYDDYVAKFESEKEIKAKHILVDNEDLAKEIIAKLDAKEATFDDLARKYSKDQPDLGYFTANVMVPEFSNAAFKMSKGSHSLEPVKTEFGYHVILVEDIRDTKPLPLENIQEQIKMNLSQQAVAEVIKELNDNAEVEKFDLNGKKIKAE